MKNKLFEKKIKINSIFVSVIKQNMVYLLFFFVKIKKVVFTLITNSFY